MKLFDQGDIDYVHDKYLYYLYVSLQNNIIFTTLRKVKDVIEIRKHICSQTYDLVEC